MNGEFGRFHGTGKAIRKQPPGEPQSVRDAYDAQWDQEKRLPVVAPKAPKGEKGGTR